MHNPRLLVMIAATSITSLALAQGLSPQPPIWATKPDISAYEKTENEHLAAAVWLNFTRWLVSR
jgi:hypothetical protein